MRDKKWISVVVMGLIAVTIFAVFAVFSHSVFDMVDRARRKESQNNTSILPGVESGSAPSEIEKNIVKEGAFEMVKPTVMMEYRTDASNVSSLHYGIKFLAYVDADLKKQYDNSRDASEWFMLVAPLDTFRDAENEWSGSNIYLNWEKAFIDLGKTHLKIGVTPSLTQDDVGNSYYEIKSHLVEIMDHNVNRDFVGVLCCTLKNTFGKESGRRYAEINLDQDKNNLVTVSMEALNQHFYEKRRNKVLYDEDQIDKLKESINISHYMAEYGNPPERDANGFFVDKTVYDRFYLVVLEDHLQITLGQTKDIEYSFVSGSMEHPSILWDIDSFAYFTVKDGKITGVAPCVNVPLNVYICGRPYTILVTVK